MKIKDIAILSSATLVLAGVFFLALMVSSLSSDLEILQRRNLELESRVIDLETGAFKEASHDGMMRIVPAPYKR